MALKRRRQTDVIWLSGVLVALTLLPSGLCHAGIIVGATVPARPQPALTNDRPATAANSKTSPAKPTTASNRATTDRVGSSPIDLTRRSPSTSAFVAPEAGETSAGVLGLCLELIQRAPVSDSNFARILIEGGPVGVLSPTLAEPGDTWGPYGGNAWLMPRNPLFDGSLSGWPGTDLLHGFEMRGIATVDVLASDLAAVGRFSAPSMMSATFGNGISNGPAVGSSDGSQHHLVAESHARGVSSGVSSTPRSSDDQSPPESAGNLLWFLAAALGVYPLLRGRSGSRS